MLAMLSDLVPELVDKIVSLLPKKTYNEVYRLPSTTSIYDEVPQTIEVGGRFGQWDRIPSFKTLISVAVIDEFIDVHQRLPLFPLLLIVAQFKTERLFFEAHSRCPDILRHYRVSIENPTSKLSELEQFPYVVESIGPSYYTGFYPEYCTDLMVGANELAEDDVAGNWKRIVFKDTDTYGMDFNAINNWQIPNLQHIEVCVGMQSLVLFRYTPPLESFKITTIFSYLPDLSLFTVKTLKIHLIHDLAVERVLIVPECVQDFDISSAHPMVVDLVLPDGLKHLKVRNILSAIGISPSLVKLELQPIYKSMDLSEYTHIEDLRITRENNHLPLTLKVPKSLKLLSTNVDYAAIENIRELEMLENLTLLGPLLQPVEVPPNVLSCYIPLFNTLQLTLNHKLEALLVLGMVTSPLKIPKSMKWLELMDYVFPLDLPDDLEVLKLISHTDPVKTPKNLRFLAIENTRHTEIELVLNLRLKRVLLEFVVVDFATLKLPKLNYMVLKNCQFDPSLVPKEYVNEGEGTTYKYRRRR